MSTDDSLAAKHSRTSTWLLVTLAGIITIHRIVGAAPSRPSAGRVYARLDAANRRNMPQVATCGGVRGKSLTRSAKRATLPLYRRHSETMSMTCVTDDAWRSLSRAESFPARRASCASSES